MDVVILATGAAYLRGPATQGEVALARLVIRERLVELIDRHPGQGKIFTHGGGPFS
jgi:hypothetical protein